MSDAPDPTPPAEGEATADARCPVCAAPVPSGTETFPFCSQRCRYVNLGRWLDGKYRISRGQRDDAAES